MAVMRSGLLGNRSGTQLGQNFVVKVAQLFGALGIGTAVEQLLLESRVGGKACSQ